MRTTKKNFDDEMRAADGYAGIRIAFTLTETLIENVVEELRNHIDEIDNISVSPKLFHEVLQFSEQYNSEDEKLHIIQMKLPVCVNCEFDEYEYQIMEPEY